MNPIWTAEIRASNLTSPALKRAPIDQQKKDLKEARRQYYNDTTQDWKRQQLKDPQFDTQIREYRLTKSYQGIPIYIKNYKASSEQIFKDSFVLPYNLLGQPKGQELKEWIEYANILKSIYKTRVPKIYKISRTHYADDLGRLYRMENGHLTFRQGTDYTTDRRSRPTLTEQFTATTISLRQPLYYFTGIAGYPTTTRMKLAASNNIDFHHANENLYDVRPTNIIPLPILIHRAFDHYSNEFLFFQD